MGQSGERKGKEYMVFFIFIRITLNFSVILFSVVGLFIIS